MTSATARRAACSCCVLGCCFDTWRALSGRCFAQPGMCKKSYFRVASVCNFHLFRPSQGFSLQWKIFCRHLISGATRCRVMSRTQGCAAAQPLRVGWPSSKAPQREGLLWISFFSDALGRPRACFLAPRLPVVILFWGSPRLPRHAAVERASVAAMFTSPGPYISVEWSARRRRPREQFSARKLRRPFEHGRSREF